MKILLIINESPYGSERAWNALRLATALQQEVPGTQLPLFLLSDGVYSALPEHHRPEGSYNIGQMLASLIASGAEVLACVTCIDQRGLWTQSSLRASNSARWWNWRTGQQSRIRCWCSSGDAGARNRPVSTAIHLALLAGV